MRFAVRGSIIPDIRPRGCAITAKADTSKRAVALVVPVIDADGFQLIAGREYNNVGEITNDLLPASDSTRRCPRALKALASLSPGQRPGLQTQDLFRTLKEFASADD